MIRSLSGRGRDATAESTPGPQCGQKDFEISNDTMGNRTRDLPACSAVPQPTAPPRAPTFTDMTVLNLCYTHPYSPLKEETHHRSTLKVTDQEHEMNRHTLTLTIFMSLIFNINITPI